MSAPAPVVKRAADWRVDWRGLTMVAALVAIWVVFSILTSGVFLLPRNLTLLARQMAVTAILAAGMVLVVVAGQIDLSVGALAGLCGALAALACGRAGWPLGLAMAAAIGAGAVLGALQGGLVARLRVPPFVATLGGMLLYQGTLLGITGGVSVSPPRAFLAIGQAFLPRPAGWLLAAAVAALALARAARAGVGVRRWGAVGIAGLALLFVAVMNAYQGVPVPVLLVLVIASLLAAVARHTPFGRHLYAIGGNREAAFYSGIPIERRLVGIFTLMGGLAGLAGIVLTARVGSATPNAGQLMELDAIAAAVIGGASLVGGQGTVWGALLGALVMASLDNGMSLLNTEAFWQPILKGSILVAAVAVDLAGRKRS